MSDAAKGTTVKLPPSHHIIEHGPSVGQHYGIDIPAYFLTADGKRHEYDRLAKCDKDGGTPLDQLAANESVIAPGLIYRESRRGPQFGEDDRYA